MDVTDGFINLGGKVLDTLTYIEIMCTINNQNTIGNTITNIYVMFVKKALKCTETDLYHMQT